MSGLAGQMLFGVTPADPGVFALAAAALGATALAAGWWPARRASANRPDDSVAGRLERTHAYRRLSGLKTRYSQPSLTRRRGLTKTYAQRIYYMRGTHSVRKSGLGRVTDGCGSRPRN